MGRGAVATTVGVLLAATGTVALSVGAAGSPRRYDGPWSVWSRVVGSGASTTMQVPPSALPGGEPLHGPWSWNGSDILWTDTDAIPRRLAAALGRPLVLRIVRLHPCGEEARSPDGSVWRRFLVEAVEGAIADGAAEAAYAGDWEVTFDGRGAPWVEPFRLLPDGTALWCGEAGGRWAVRDDVLLLSVARRLPPSPDDDSARPRETRQVSAVLRGTQSFTGLRRFDRAPAEGRRIR